MFGTASQLSQQSQQQFFTISGGNGGTQQTAGLNHSLPQIAQAQQPYGGANGNHQAQLSYSASQQEQSYMSDPGVQHMNNNPHAGEHGDFHSQNRHRQQVQPFTRGGQEISPSNAYHNAQHRYTQVASGGQNHTAFLPTSSLEGRIKDNVQSQQLMASASLRGTEQDQSTVGGRQQIYQSMDNIAIAPNQQKQQQANATNGRESRSVNKKQSEDVGKGGSGKAYTELFVWGNDQYGQLGLGHKYLTATAKPSDRRDEGEPIPNQRKKILENPKSCSFSIQIRDVACGEDFAFLLTKKGLLYAMGSNQFGKLGILSPQNLQAGDPGHLVPGQQSPEQIPFASTPKLVESLAKHVIKKVACGLNHAVAVTEDQSGLCYSWGCGSHGQLGRASNNVLNLNPPQVVSYFATRSLKVTDVAAGGKHTLFMTDCAQVLGAGMNDFGQLGQGDVQVRLQKNAEPLEVINLRENARQITCGLVHSQILLNNGRVVTFGDNQFGQLGLGAEAGITSTGTPTEIPSLQNIQSIACNHHSAAIGARGELYFWGTGVFGTFFEPRVVVDADIAEVSIGGSFGIARDKDGLLWTWGQNSNGELGLNDQKTRLYPHPILPLKRKQISKAVCGGSFAVAIGPDKQPDGRTRGSPHKRKKSPFHNDSTLLKILQEKQQAANGNAAAQAQSDQLHQEAVSDAAPAHVEHNVRIFSARQQEAAMVDSNGDASQSRTLQADPSCSQLTSNPDVYGYFNEKRPLSNTTQSLFGNLHNQSQLHVREDRRQNAARAYESADLNQSKTKARKKSGSRSNSRHSRQRVPAAGRQNHNNSSLMRRSVSPILATHHSTQNLSSNPSFISSSAAKQHSMVGQSVQTGGFGGAVQAPRKKKSASRSKSKTASKSQSRNGATVARASLRHARGTSQSKLHSREPSKQELVNLQTHKSQNTFELAAQRHENSFGGAPGSATLMREQSQNSAKFPTEQSIQAQGTITQLSLQAKQDKERIEALEREMYYIRQENEKLHGQVNKQRESMAEVREMAHKGRPGHVMDQLTEEVQKAHDLEYLLRNKERTIEILRGDVDEARALKLEAEQNLEKVQAQNIALLQENQGLQEDSKRLQEALDHTMQVCGQIKTQRDAFSDRFGYLSNEMTSLREMANDIKSQKNTAEKAQGYQTQQHTAGRPSFDRPPSSANALAPANASHRAGANLLRLGSTKRPSKERRHATLGQVSNDGRGANKLDLEQQYLHRVPETTKHEENFNVEIPAGTSSIHTKDGVEQPFSQTKSDRIDVQSSNVSGSFPLIHNELQRNPPIHVEDIASQNLEQANAESNHSLQHHSETFSKEQQQQQHFMKTGEEGFFSMQDLDQPAGASVDQIDQRTVVNEDQSLYEKEHADQVIQDYNPDDCEVTAVSAHEHQSHNDNYDNKGDTFAADMLRRENVHQPTSLTTTKKRAAGGQHSRKRSSSKENFKSTNNTAKQTNFGIAFLRRSTESTSNKHHVRKRSASKDKVPAGAKRRRSNSAGKKNSLGSTGNNTVTNLQGLLQAAQNQQPSTVVPEPVIILTDQKNAAAFNQYQQQQPQQVLAESQTYSKQINLTVDSINKLAEIINSEHQMLQQSLNMGYQQDQNNTSYIANKNQGDHSVLLRSPPIQNGSKDEDSNFISAATGFSGQNDNLAKQHQQLLQQQRNQTSLNIFQQNLLDSQLSQGNTNPLLVASGHDMAAQQQKIVSQMQSQEEDSSALSAMQQQQFKNKYLLSVDTVDGRANQQQEQPSPSDSAENPYRQQRQTSISKSLAKMQRDGLTQLNRKPELAAALRKSHHGSHQDQQTFAEDDLEMSCRQSSPIDLGPAFRKSHLMHNTRSASLNHGLAIDSSKSVPAIARKKDTIDNFKSKLSRLEKNKQDLENKMKLFDAKVKAHTITTSVVTDTE